LMFPHTLLHRRLEAPGSLARPRGREFQVVTIEFDSEFSRAPDELCLSFHPVADSWNLALVQYLSGNHN